MEEQPAKISEEPPLPLSSNLFLSDLNVLCLSRFDDFRFDTNNSAVKYQEYRYVYSRILNSIRFN